MSAEIITEVKTRAAAVSASFNEMTANLSPADLRPPAPVIVDRTSAAFRSVQPFTPGGEVVGRAEGPFGEITAREGDNGVVFLATAPGQIKVLPAEAVKGLGGPDMLAEIYGAVTRGEATADPLLTERLGLMEVDGELVGEHFGFDDSLPATGAHNERFVPLKERFGPDDLVAAIKHADAI